MPNNQKTEATIEFIDSHRPALGSGAYDITVTQQIQIPKRNVDETFKQALGRFFVAGDRFRLNAAEIHSVFPPEGSLGEHSNVLPHIILNRSTLPWERRADPDPHTEEIQTWLALLVLDGNEAPTPQIVPVTNLSVALESYEDPAEKISVIDVDKDLLSTLVPTFQELKLLAHVRRAVDGTEQAVIVANRLPIPAATSRAYLVSVEGQYSGGKFNPKVHARNTVTLVCLKSWSFACVDMKQDFKGLLTHLNSATLRLPQDSQADDAGFSEAGYVSLPRLLRDGSNEASWYHSPLATGERKDSLPLPASASDELLCLDAQKSKYDLSYAAAWELGRLVALQSKKLSISLYHWKRKIAQNLNQQKQRLLYAHLPGQSAPATTLDIPDDIGTWFRGLSLLQGVPFNYLLPDASMLPQESIRFFWLDRLWIDCLLDGAFSIGRVTANDRALDERNDCSPAKNQYPVVTGFLLRSEVVAGWPSLLVDAYDEVTAGGNQLEQLRFDHLSKDVLIGLYSGSAKRFEIHQKPEALHFGFDREESSPDFYKTLRDANGKTVYGEDNKPIQVKISGDPMVWTSEPRRIMRIGGLTQKLQSKLKWDNFTSAQFALEMIEGVEKVNFEYAV